MTFARGLLYLINPSANEIYLFSAQVNFVIVYIFSKSCFTSWWMRVEFL